MKIQSVEYRRLVTHGDYQNTAIGAVATVEEGQSPIQALEALEAWVDVQLRKRARLAEDISAKWAERRQLEDEIARLHEARRLAETNWNKAKAFLAQHGVNVAEPSDLFDSLPF